MKTREEVESRLRALLVEELDRRVEEARKRRPHLCRFNHQHLLDDRKTVDGESNDRYNQITVGLWEPVDRTIGLCMYGQEDPEEWGGNICEDDIDAQRCPMFEPIKTKETILEELSEQIGTPGWVDRNMPGVVELAWVLDKVAVVPPLPWWKRFWYHHILRIRIEPLKASVNILNLLPALELPQTSGEDDEGIGT